MAQSYSNYKQNLNEQEQKLLEIGQLVPPYTKNFIFDETENMVRSDFKDDKKNNISVRFHKHKKGSDSFEIEFNVNGFSGEAFKTDQKHFFKIISTVIQVINEFIEKYNPSQLFIEGADKPGKEGQKDKLWLQYAKVNLKADGYTIGNNPNGFLIQNNLKINK
jgi:hypothetical protein